MYEVECELADSLMRPVERAPVLSVVIPTFCRPLEVTEAVVSIAQEVVGDLEGKVEIIVTDNASGPDTLAALKTLAETYPFVSYRIHANDMGGPVQIMGAPFRARGRWTWVFGDDDALAPGCLAPIVELLERDQPAFVTLNREVWNPTFDKMLAAGKHDRPDLGFDTFLDLLALFGFDQLSFLTSQIYDTEIARSVDPAPYLASLCRFVQLGYYVEAFHDKSAAYVAKPSVRHRWNPEARDVHAANFLDLATALPEIVQYGADKAGLAPGFFERVGGRRAVVGQDLRGLTFVDNILENLWRCLAIGTPISPEQWAMLEGLSHQWRPDRAEQLKTVHDLYGGVSSALAHRDALVADHQRRVALGARTQDEMDMLGRIAEAVKSLETDINDARKAAFDMAGNFG